MSAVVWAFVINAAVGARLRAPPGQAFPMNLGSSTSDSPPVYNNYYSPVPGTDAQGVPVAGVPVPGMFPCSCCGHHCGGSCGCHQQPNSNTMNLNMAPMGGTYGSGEPAPTFAESSPPSSKPEPCEDLELELERVDDEAKDLDDAAKEAEQDAADVEVIQHEAEKAPVAEAKMDHIQEELSDIEPLIRQDTVNEELTDLQREESQGKVDTIDEKLDDLEPVVKKPPVENSVKEELKHIESEIAPISSTLERPPEPPIVREDPVAKKTEVWCEEVQETAKEAKKLEEKVQQKRNEVKRNEVKKQLEDAAANAESALIEREAETDGA